MALPRPLLVLALLAAGCDCGGGTAAQCSTDSDCAGAERCVDERCVPRPDAGGATDAGDGDDDAGPPRDAGDADGGVPCGADGSCEGDARCVAEVCVPWADGEFDDTCVRTPDPGPVLPQIQCAFEATPDGDPRPDAVRMLHTPLVANLQISAAPDVPPRPSIVYVADYGYREGVPRVCNAEGILRILDGATCRQQAVFDEVPLNSPVTPAIGDLDGDGVPEIVTSPTEGGLIALAVASDGTVTERWRSTTPDGSRDLLGSAQCQWGAVSMYDLDDDGRPELLFEGGVWDADGVRIASLPGWVHISHGTPVPVGDFDGDGAVEAVAGNTTWQYDVASGDFVVEASSPVAAGFTAVADLGDFPAVAGDVPGQPEIVSAFGGVVSVRTLSGALIRSHSTTTSGNGGPPTIADFDGDGVREIGVAFGGSYEVIDLAEAGDVLWTQPSQDLSSSRTGSSVFDFNADGSAEVVYGDECFVRVYDGATGEVQFSQARFSSTWTENPIVADVDGDASAEMVMGASGPCSTPYCPLTDPLFAGLRCEGPDDCPSGTCTAGLCRCASDDECPTTYGCTAPLEGSDGDVCRAFHRDCVAGVRVYRDGRDRWASSRTIWNQHGYHVTNVNEDGTVPRTSAVSPNWSDADLNNFRQNVQGGLGPTPGPDLTIQDITAVCVGADSTDMQATLCNRGAVFLDLGLQVVFDQIADDGSRTRLCDLRTTEPVAPGECTMVSCTAPVPADGVFEATADDEALVGECREANNSARSEADCLE